MRITLNRDKVKELIKAKIRSALSAAISSNSYSHTNYSGSISPAQWWVDKPVYQGAKVRHEMETSIGVRLNGDTIIVKLDYTMKDISPTN